MSRCQLVLSPDCAGDAEVSMTASSFVANTCLPCGKDWQRKYPHCVADLSIRPLFLTETQP